MAHPPLARRLVLHAVMAVLASLALAGALIAGQTGSAARPALFLLFHTLILASLGGLHDRRRLARRRAQGPGEPEPALAEAV